MLFLRSGSCFIIMNFVTYFSVVKTWMCQILVGLCFSAIFLFALNTTNADQRDPESDYEAALSITKETLKQEKVVHTNDAIVVVAGFPFGLAGSTNAIRVEHI